jgi:hypothetical protein
MVLANEKVKGLVTPEKLSIIFELSKIVRGMVRLTLLNVVMGLACNI